MHATQPGQLSQYGLDDRGFNSRLEKKILVFSTAFRLHLRPVHLSLQWELGATSMVIKWPEREAHHLPPSNAEVNTGCSYTSTTS
jgi:hypothetical protein